MASANTKFNTKYLVRLAVLIGIILLMAFTPLGYFKTLGLSVTLIQIPVVVGAIILGPTAGAVLGLVFGATSFFQCFGLEAFGTALMGINPVGTFVTCFVPRILMGWLSGLIFLALSKFDKTKWVGYPVTCLLGALLNTLLFMTSLVLFFYDTEFIQNLAGQLGTAGILAFVMAFVGINGIIEAIASCVAGGAIAKGMDHFRPQV